MNLGMKIPAVNLPSIKAKRPLGKTVFVQWDRQSIEYMVVSKDRSGLRAITQEKVERTDDQSPLQQVAQRLKQDKVSIGQFVVLLSRTDLEMVNVTLPPAQFSELPDLVQAQVEEQLGDSDQMPVVDHLLSQFSETEGGEALAFAMSAEVLDRLKQDAKRSGARLAVVTPRSLASLGLLRELPLETHPLAIAITLFDNEIELMVLQEGQPNALRTIRSHTDDRQVLAEQIVTEIQRCLAVTHAADDEDLHLFLFGHRDVLSHLVDTLVEQFDGPVSLLNPLDAMQLDHAIDREAYQVYAALAGAAKSYFMDRLTVNLIEPKRAPKPPNPIRRWAVIGAAAVAAVLGVVYVLASDLQQLQAEVDAKQKAFDSKANMARKRQEKADDVRVAENWLQDEVNWLEELKALSDVLPGGQDVTVRRLTASAGGGGSDISLSVQVSEPQKFAEFETRLRGLATSVRSSRVSEQSGDEEYPWQFESQLTLPDRSTELTPPDSVVEDPTPDENGEPVAEKSNADGAVEPTAQGNQPENESSEATEQASPTSVAGGKS